MDKITFLNELETELDDLPRKEKDKVMKISFIIKKQKARQMLKY